MPERCVATATTSAPQLTGRRRCSVSRTAGRPCVVFLDLRMPGMDGWELSRRLRDDERWKDLPVVVVAAHFRIDREAAEIGAVSWLQKPFDLARLDEETKAFCERD